jgi:hypothetical protein
VTVPPIFADGSPTSIVGGLVLTVALLLLSTAALPSAVYAGSPAVHAIAGRRREIAAAGVAVLIGLLVSRAPGA